MKLRSVKYLTGEGIKNIWVNRLMSIASIGVLVACMVLIGLALLISLNVDKGIGEIESQNVVMVFFNDENSVIYGTEEIEGGADKDSDTNSSSSDTSSKEEDEDKIPEDSYLIHNEEEALAVCEEIRKLDNVSEVKYVSAADAFDSLKETYLEGKEEYFTALEGDENPLSCGARVVLEDLSDFEKTVADIRNVEGVYSVTFQGELADTISSVKNGIAIAGAWIIAILLVIALVIVSNTIRVTMYSRKLEISIMKVVGATDSFIRLPFVVEGIMLGLISAALSEGLVYVCYRVAADAMKISLGAGSLVRFSSVALTMFGAFVLIGVFAGLFGSLFMINKYLRKEGSEFKAL